ncbi:MAG: redoxin domain-containing protein [Candidatus Hydrogenedens sp.]|nr:redoxin domain-containing protein [Candidatus Hydrogenedens sp.]
MKWVRLIVHGFTALLAIASVGVLTYQFVAHGDAPFPSWRRSFDFLGLYFEAHIFYIALLFGVPAAVLCGWRTLCLLGRAAEGPGLRAASTLMAVLVLGSLSIVALRFQLWNEVLGGPEAEPMPLLSDAEFEYPDLPLAPEDAEPAWMLTGLDGQEIAFASLQGKAVFLNYWATWCGPCQREMPNLQRLYDALKGNDKVVFLFVSNEEAETVKAWNDKNTYTLPLYTAGDAPKKLRPRAFPTTVILAPDGRIAFEHIGAAAWDGERTRGFLEALAAQ